MAHAYVRARRILTLALLFAAVPTFARPLLVPPKQRLSVPQLVAEQYPGQYPTFYRGPVIDGDTLLVNARRMVDTAGNRDESVHLFQRAADGTWNYVREFHAGPGYPLVNGNLATVQVFGSLLVYERGAQGWKQTATVTMDQASRVAIRIDDGSIYVENRSPFGQPGCFDPVQQWKKVNGTWQVVATVGPQSCNDDSNVADINDARALLIRRPPNYQTPQPPAQIYAQGTPTWSPVADLPAPPLSPTYVNWYGPMGSLNGSFAYIYPGYMFRNGGGDNWVPAGHLVEPESELDLVSQLGRMRGNSLFLYGYEYDYEIPSHDEDFPSSWSTVRIYRPRSNGYFDYYARLSADFSVWEYGASEDGTRAVATSARDNYDLEEPSVLYVFEIPDNVTFAGTQQDTFEAGNFSKWTANVGQFHVVQTNESSKVLRQSSIAGDAKAYITGIDWTDQAIEADMRPRAFDGADRWFGLATRRVDNGNYYYATYRLPNKVSLRRMKNGVVTELAYGFMHDDFVPGRSYRVRLESVGDQHAVFLDGFPVAHAKDSSFTHGHPGVVSYRTTFDVDNVIVSSGTRLLLRLDTYQRNWSQGRYQLTSGVWNLVREPSDDVNVDGESIAFVLRQSDTSGDAKWFSKFAVGNQVISTRVRPNSFGTTTGTNDAWVGIAAHVVDDKNYYYVTLRRQNELSLRRMVNGQVQVVATVPQSVVPGKWYDLRFEIIGLDLRVFVNGNLKISARDPNMTGGGKNGILMYKTAADFYHYIAYQP